MDRINTNKKTKKSSSFNRFGFIQINYLILSFYIIKVSKRSYLKQTLLIIFKYYIKKSNFSTYRLTLQCVFHGIRLLRLILRPADS